MIFVTNADGKATYVSSEWTALTGQRLADAVDYGWARVVPPEDVDLVRGLVAEAIARQSAFSVCHRLLSPDGRITWVVAGAVPSFGPPDGTFLGFLGSITPLAAPPAEGAVAHGSLGSFSPPALPQEPDSEPDSILERVADLLILVHALIVRSGTGSGLAAVEIALHEVGRELAKAADEAAAESAEAGPPGSILH